MDEDIRWIQRFDNYCKALDQLKSGVSLSIERGLSELEKQGLIQAFEFTHELSWNCLKDFLTDRGNKGIYGSKDAVRESFKYGLIQDGQIWMEMIKSRNSSSHTYNKITADKIVEQIVTQYLNQFEVLSIKLNALKSEQSE